jgi:uncharacterized membrane protein
VVFDCSNNFLVSFLPFHILVVLYVDVHIQVCMEVHVQVCMYRRKCTYRCVCTDVFHFIFSFLYVLAFLLSLYYNGVICVSISFVTVSNGEVEVHYACARRTFLNIVSTRVMS